VHTFDPGSHSGQLTFDDGTEVTFDAVAFNRGRLRRLRPGQRVALSRDDNGRVVDLTLSTFPPPGTDPRTTGLGRP
jgi:cold shock CspA family protein